jgi:GNAT superfamily N-acetyltransferase
VKHGSGPAFALQTATADDFEALLALRLRAMRHSLTQLGRYDEPRARERLAAGFDPAKTQHIMVGGKRVGFIVLKRLSHALRLDHFYIDPSAQGRGIGSAVMRWVCKQADDELLPVELCALKGSAANRFYLHHGYALTGEGEWDNDYLRMPTTPSLRAVRRLWAALQARDWAAARALLHAELQANWRSSGERFDGAEAFIAAQALQPEGRTIALLELLHLQDGRVLSVVRVDHAAQTCFATSLWRLDDGVITGIDEYWSTVDEPADARAGLPGRTLLNPRDDARARQP